VAAEWRDGVLKMIDGKSKYIEKLYHFKLTDPNK
jgi:hypothetical protein